jgi:nocturnin
MNDNFGRCPAEALNWRTRRFRIVEEIVRHNPDVVCLQEVEHFQFLQVLFSVFDLKLNM